MRSSTLIVLIVGALAVGWHLFHSSAAYSQRGASTLPGATPAIDAAEYPSLQAAIDALPPTGGSVRLPAGHFEISEPLRVGIGDVSLEGSGGATLIKNLNETGQPTLLIAHPECTDAKTQRKFALWRVRVANLRLEGNPLSGPGIEARQINEIFLDGVSVSRHGSDGIRLDHCYEDPRVANSLITYNRAVGLNLIGCHDIVVAANQFEENQDALHCTDGFNLCLTGNCVDDHLGDGVVIENTYGSVVSGNMIEECNGRAVVLDRDCYGITISANVIAHNGGGVDLLDAHGCAVSANTFTILKADALRLRQPSGRIAVSGNSFCNSDIGDGQVRRATDDFAAAGIVIEGGAQSGITGNVFSGLTTRYVTLAESASKAILFSGNVLTSNDSDHGSLPPAPAGGNLVTE